MPDYESGPLSNADYDDCFYNEYLPGSIDLADEIIAATGNLAAANQLSDVPVRGPVTTSYMEQWVSYNLCRRHLLCLLLQR